MHQHRTLAFGVSLGVAAALLGGAALKLLSPAPANAQIAGFHAVSVTASQAGPASFAWFVGNNGEARVCAYDGHIATPCAVVKF